MIQRGEIWLADFNPRMGTEPGKVRPVVIIQSDLLNEVHPSIIVCPIPTQVNPELKLLRIGLDEKINGLNKPSAILTDQIRAIDNSRLMKKLGKVSSSQ